MNIYLSKELKEAFERYCNARAQKMSSVIQLIIKKVMSGEINLLEEKKDNG